MNRSLSGAVMLIDFSRFEMKFCEGQSDFWMRIFVIIAYSTT